MGYVIYQDKSQQLLFTLRSVFHVPKSDTSPFLLRDTLAFCFRGNWTSDKITVHPVATPVFTCVPVSWSSPASCGFSMYQLHVFAYSDVVLPSDFWVTRGSSSPWMTPLSINTFVCKQNPWSPIACPCLRVFFSLTHPRVSSFTKTFSWVSRDLVIFVLSVKSFSRYWLLETPLSGFLSTCPSFSLTCVHPPNS